MWRREINCQYTGGMVELNGSVERITYYNTENGYTVLRLKPEGKGKQKPLGLDLEGLLTVVGNLPELSPGQHIHLKGDYVTHPKHGLQFKAEACETVEPITIEGIERYLGSGLFKGIGPELAKRIVKKFKTKTLEIIEYSPERLREVPGIGLDRTNKILKAWEEQRQVQEIMLFLHAHQVSTHLAVKIYKTYGEKALEVVKDDPYQLEKDIYGVGFKTADKIAQDIGVPDDHPSRIEAGIVYVLNSIVNDGHVYAPLTEISDKTAALLSLPPELISFGFRRLEDQGRIKQVSLALDNINQTGEIDALNQEQPVIYLSPYFYSEKGVADRLKELMVHKVKPIQQSLLGAEENLSQGQKLAIEMALHNPVSILTGGPGTGKTTCMKSLIGVLEDNQIRYALASPTGRAAKRLSEATSRPASTIHRLLGYSPGKGFAHDENQPLKIDFLIVDEASMLDVLLSYSLLRALKPGTQILFVGDVDQLPSVGAGDVLREMINSQVVPVSELHQIFRQAANSQIISNAHRINQGKFPEFSKSERGDFFLFPTDDSESAAQWVSDLVCSRIPQKFGFDPMEDIQVLTPMYRGAAGVDALNDLLQDQLNPIVKGQPDVKMFGRTYRVGDKIMQIRNNYDKDVFNGDIGLIKMIDTGAQQVIVTFDKIRDVPYDYSEMDELMHAYAVTVHKAQGSEFPAVVVPFLTQHYVMLQRNLIYTAVTRAEKLCVLVGNNKAIRIALNNTDIAKRNSNLSNLLSA